VCNYLRSGITLPEIEITPNTQKDWEKYERDMKKYKRKLKKYLKRLEKKQMQEMENTEA